MRISGKFQITYDIAFNQQINFGFLYSLQQVRRKLKIFFQRVANQSLKNSNWSTSNFDSNTQQKIHCKYSFSLHLQYHSKIYFIFNIKNKYIPKHLGMKYLDCMIIDQGS